MTTAISQKNLSHMNANRSTVGIVGGLCPLATADIYLKAMRQVKADHGDGDYPDIIISSAVEQTCRGNVFDEMRNYDMSHRMLYVYQVACELKRQHVSRILVPDFLTYNSLSSISRNIQIPIIDLVDIITRRIQAEWPSARSIGILTTSASIQAQIFDRAFSRANLCVIYPDDEIQKANVMEAIYGHEGVKRGCTSGKIGQLIHEACAHLFEKGADLIATAVTELPLIERCHFPQKAYLDCNEAIGRELIQSHVAAATTGQRDVIVGILGGLGPSATVDIFEKIIKNTPANRDQDHVKIIIDNNPQVPDRTEAINGNGEDPSVALLASAERLRDAGVDFIIVPCNTAHAFMQSIQRHINIPILSMIEETVRHIVTTHTSVKRVGLLATSGTIRSGVYSNPFLQTGIELLVPSASTQHNLVMEAIYGKNGIKAGNRFDLGLPRKQLLTAAQELIGAGAQLIVLGCTEIPLVINGDIGVPTVDPTEILAMAAVKRALRARASII